MAKEPIKAGEVSVKVNVDVSDALKGLKAVQRLARETAESLKMAEALSLNIADTDRERYLLELFRLCKDNFEKDRTFSYREINEAVFQAVTEGGSFSVIYKDRCEGFTTSAIAVAKTFENVWLVVSNEVLADRIRKDYGVPTLSYKNFPANVRGLSTHINTVIIDVEDHDISKIPPRMFEKVILATDRSGSHL